MNDLQWQQIFLTIAGAAATLFPVIYTVFTRGKCWRSQIGRALNVSDISLALLVDLALLAYWFHWTVPIHVSTAITALIAVAALLRCWAVIDIQVIKRLRSHPTGEPDTEL